MQRDFEPDLASTGKAIMTHATPMMTDEEELVLMQEILQNTAIYPPRIAAMSFDIGSLVAVEPLPTDRGIFDQFDPSRILYRDNDSVFVNIPLPKIEQTVMRGIRVSSHDLPEYESRDFIQLAGRRERSNAKKQRDCGFCKIKFVNKETGLHCSRCLGFFCCDGCKIVHQCR